MQIACGRQLSNLRCQLQMHASCLFAVASLHGPATGQPLYMHTKIPTLTQMLCAAVQCSPPQISMQAARAESEMVMFDSIKAALAKANLKPSQVRLPDSNQGFAAPRHLHQLNQALS